MLGSNLGKQTKFQANFREKLFSGKKVTAGVVQDQYKQFLKNKPDEKKKTLTPEERKQAKRAEMRKRGIFVKADDPDETPTILEKIDGPSQPMVYVLPEKPTVWKTSKKKTGTRKHKKQRTEKKPLEKSHKSQTSIKSEPKKKAKTEKKGETVSIPSSSSSATDQSSQTSKKRSSAEKAKKSPDPNLVQKEDLKPNEVMEKPVEEEKKPMAPEQVKVEEHKFVEPVLEGKEQKDEKVVEQKSEEKLEVGNVNKIEPPAVLEQKVLPDSPEVPKAPSEPPNPVDIQPTPQNNSDAAKKEDDKSKRENVPLTVVYSNPSISVSKNFSTTPLAENQAGAFDKLDDDEFEKMTSDVDEKEILKLAPRLLKVAKKHAAIEKCLTPEENEVLAKFFSGKQKLDSNVLAVLDSALDKIIDYLQKNNCAVDEETKAVMKKRDKLKAAMMKEFLVSPQYLPKTWTAKFNEWKSEAEKQKNGINWFRVFFSYPKHKSFEDGPEDTFGNFRRRNRGILMGLILGPGDVKSFEETKREDDCQGMFLDTKIMEKATAEKDNGSTISEHRTLNTTKSSKK
ncbi:DUF7774 domain-containing protein [Caenorhabditis elegans]|uniref:DEK_C domain-containing protein n=1 Tax=Caenorhabditis elegans TaxID=6239 RepID=O61823_CAEEL|nr:DEK_C domain-containing protein [Caenorhabditis elegans]CCD62109.1 DEK_C domain-containing protein [Caenorhabditis elegans]|eukprot:NP_492788.2 Uncharacterized protein CELE_B0511.11 [Caenorhabditis elegans]